MSELPFLFHLADSTQTIFLDFLGKINERLYVLLDAESLLAQSLVTVSAAAFQREKEKKSWRDTYVFEVLHHVVKLVALLELVSLFLDRLRTD